jgi:hypothetical protein
MWERERRFKLQNKKDIRFSTLARWIFFQGKELRPRSGWLKPLWKGRMSG